MRVLIINKFLYPNGGSETYIFKLGEALEQHGHEVQYFGMEHEGRCVGNRVNAYTSGMDFHGGSKLSKLTYPIKTIYSKEARVQLRKVLDDFKPDVCHLNNFNYQLTPSIILEIVKWRKETGRDCKIIFTAHDYQLVCPNHMLNNPNTHQNCEKCLGGHFVNCMKGKCIHSSTAKSAMADWVPLLENHDLSYEIEIPETEYMTRVDSTAYTRILNNLLQNILTHSDASKVFLTVTETEQQAKIVVADNGNGIAASDLPHIFERMYQCDHSRSAKGNGLGLSIAKELVSIHKGTITAASVPGNGTTFIIILPKAL